MKTDRRKNDTATNQGASKVGSKDQELGEVQGVSLELQRECGPADHLISDSQPAGPRENGCQY